MECFLCGILNLVCFHGEDGLYVFNMFNALSALPAGDCEEKEVINHVVCECHFMNYPF